MKRLVFGLFIALCFSGLSAQSLKINVLDGDLELPLEGVRVVLKGNSFIKTETDADGAAELQLPEDFQKGTVITQLLGYSDKETEFTVEESEITILLTVAGVIEGKELVVKRAAPIEEAKSGVAVVMNKEQMNTVANAGLVEDVMSAVNTMPGVSYTGSFNSEPSIRGGYPRELSTVLDGIYILYPWHWGGAYSIFNPAMIESVKMSNGIYSAKYGRALSGLMEATTIKPDSGKFHADLSVTYLSTDAFFQIPFGEKAGMLIGGKCTYLEGYIGAFRLLVPGSDATDALKRPPYIRDFYTKAYFNPTDKLEFSLNAFYGSDGLELSSETEDNGEKDSFNFDYDVHRAFVGLNTKWLVTDRLQLSGLFSYNITYEDLSLISSTEGVFKYNDEFKSKYADKITGDTYTLPKQTDEFAEKITEHQWQGKLEADLELEHNHVISFGAEEVLANSTADELMNAWTDWNMGDGSYQLKKLYNTEKIDGNFMLNSAAFATWNFGSESTLLQGEAGVRLDHVYCWNREEDFSLNTKLDVNPRFTIAYTPWRNKNIFDKVTFSAGTGVFSSTPLEFILAGKQHNLKDYETKQNRALFNVIGTDIAFLDDWNFKLEGYYKYYLSRLYIVSNDRDPANVKNSPYFDGLGHTIGFDTMLEKKHGEIYDGYLSYSFVYAKFKNPIAPEYDDQTSNQGEPLNEWFYPSYHRFNTMNLVLNIRPKKGWTLTTKAVFATGTPRNGHGAVTSYAATGEDGATYQRYTRSNFYSDTLRTDISCPIDIRVSYGGNLKKHPNVYREWYIAAEDIFQNLYSPTAEKSFDKRTGKETDASTDANFGIGIPLISMGMKFKF